MNRTRVLRAAAITAAVVLQVHQNRALRNEARIHEGDLEAHQAHIDRLNAHCGIADESPRADAGVITAAERIANKQRCEALARGFTAAERRDMAALDALFADEEVQW